MEKSLVKKPNLSDDLADADFKYNASGKKYSCANSATRAICRPGCHRIHSVAAGIIITIIHKDHCAIQWQNNQAAC